MGTGLPVIVTDVGMNARIVDNEISGLVVPPENFDAMGAALVRLLENRSLAETMAAKAFEAVRTHFSVEVMSREYESLFFALAGRQRDADPIIG
jgi:glycosyltransferase involved in cell wall biosynthesis